MKPAPFLYHAPASLERAFALLDEYGDDAKPLAGGQSLVPAMNFRLAQPAVLVDLNRLDRLAGIERTAAGGLRIGAMTRQRALERDPRVARVAPLLAQALPHIAHPQIRNRGTLGGSLAHADPASELPAVMLVLAARLRLGGSRGERWLPAEEFFLGLFTTALAPGELLLDIEIPAAAPGSGWAFEEAARRHGDYALAGVAAGARLDADGRCREATVVLFGVGEGPVPVPGAAAAVAGHPPSAQRIAEAAEVVRSSIDPPGDIHASPAYRRRLAAVLTRRALTRAIAAAEIALA